MRRYLPCVVFAMVVCTTSARPQVFLGQDPFRASAPVGRNNGGVPLSAVTSQQAPNFGTIGLASLDDPFAGTGLSNDLTFGSQAAPVLPAALASSPADAQAPIQSVPNSVPLSDPVLAPSSPNIANEIQSGPVFVPAPTFDPVEAPSSPDIANQIQSDPVFVPAPTFDPVEALSSPDIANQIQSGPVFVPAPNFDPVEAPSSPDIANQIQSGPVFVPAPAIDPVEIVPKQVNVPAPAIESNEVKSNAIAFPAGAPSYAPPSPDTGSSSASGAAATPGITMITKADLVYTALDVAEVNHARASAFAAAVGGSTGTTAPVIPIAAVASTVPVDPTSGAEDTSGLERANPNYSISIDPVSLSDVSGTSAPGSVSAPSPVPAPVPTGIYSRPSPV